MLLFSMALPPQLTSIDICRDTSLQYIKYLLIEYIKIVQRTSLIKWPLLQQVHEKNYCVVHRNFENFVNLYRNKAN